MTYAPQARTVAATAEFRRVLGLPKRDLTEADAQALVRDATEAFITPAGRRDGASLRPWQAAGLAEIYANRGAYLGLGVGAGKELTILLTPLVLDAKRPVLCTPAGLVQQTRDDWARYSEHWRIPNPIPRVISYEDLDDEPKLDLLDRIQPDLVMLNEADAIRNIESAAVKRLDRYRRAHWRDCDYVAYTATPGRLSIMDTWHFLIWCLRENAPVPLDRSEAETWALAIDEKASRFGARPSVGALLHLGGQGDTQVARGRDGFRRRLLSTPGIILLDTDSCDQPLTIRQIVAPHDPVLEQHFARFRGEERCTPSGEKPSDGLSVYRMANELSLGYTTYFDPPPPEEWREAQKAKNDFVYDTIRRSNWTDTPKDTEAAVMRAYPDAWQVRRWREVRDTYDPKKHRKVMWLSDSVVEFALDYAAQADAEGDPALIWSWSVPMCEALAWASRERCRLHGTRPVLWYAAKGLTKQGQYIARADPKHSAILSGGANLRGRNLQAFRRNLFIMPPMAARALEQGLGRTHRSLQERPVVVDWLVTSYESAMGLERAVGEAAFGKQTWSTSQKLLRATIERIPPEAWPVATKRFATQPDICDVAA